MKLLGLDWGSKKIGIAIALEDLVAPLKVIDRHPWKRAGAELRKICITRTITHLVLGWPCNADGTHSKRCGMVGSALDLLRPLLADLDIQIKRQDEFETSLFAGTLLSRRRVDHYAAAKILQDFITHR